MLIWEAAMPPRGSVVIAVLDVPALLSLKKRDILLFLKQRHREFVIHRFTLYTYAT